MNTAERERFIILTTRTPLTQLTLSDIAFVVRCAQEHREEVCLLAPDLVALFES